LASNKNKEGLRPIIYNQIIERRGTKAVKHQNKNNANYCHIHHLL